LSSRRHEEAERQAVKQVATDYAQFWGLVLVAAGVILLFGGPWFEWDKHGHQWGWAVLGVFGDLLGTAIAVLIIMVIISNAQSKKRKAATSGAKLSPSRRLR
jgi:hypothetical protein